jgi:hypothetical protein
VGHSYGPSPAQTGGTPGESYTMPYGIGILVKSICYCERNRRVTDVFQAFAIEVSSGDGEDKTIE